MDTSYGYNLDGDLTGIENTTLAYDELHNLVSYGTGITLLGQYAYDGNGMRVIKTTANGDTIVYHYDQGGRILSESDGNANFIEDYVYLHGKLLAKVVNTNIATVPVAPTNLTASAVSSSLISLAWTNSITDADGYVVEREAGTGGTYSQVASVQSGMAGYTDTGLDQNTTYVYRVRAFNLQSGYSSYSNEATATTQPPPAPPSGPISPSGLIAATIECNQVGLTWTNNATNADGILIERELASGGTYTQIVSLPSSSSTGTSFTDFGVSPNTSYSYRIRAYNSYGDSPYSNEITITTPALQGGEIITIVGNGQAAFSGDGGPAILATLNYPKGVAADSVGNIYIADSRNNAIRKVDVNGMITSAITEVAALGVATDSSGNIYWTSSTACLVWKQDAVSSAVTVVAGVSSPGGSVCGYVQDGIPATQAQLNNPTSIAVDNAGKIYIADFGNSRIRMVDTNGNISTIAGTGNAWFGGDGGYAYVAGLNHPSDVKVDNAGNIYILDSGNYRIRKVTSGIISTVAGNGQAGFSGDGGLATQAAIGGSSIAIDNGGNIYLADQGNNRIRGVSSTGIINTIAGNGQIGYTGDGGPAAQATLNAPYGIAVDSTLNIYIADQGNNCIRKISLLNVTILTSSVYDIVDTAISQALGAIGGKAPYTWSITTGTLPSGLSFNSAGVLSGTPTTSGTSLVTFQVTDANNSTSLKTVAFNISTPLTISTASLATGGTGIAYTQTLAATGGLLPLAWSISSGTLPIGLTLDSGTGIISGIAQFEGVSTFTVQVADATNTTSAKALSISITAPAMTAFSFVSTGSTGFINEGAKTVSVTVPYGTDVTTLSATFSTTGVMVTVRSVVQVSGSTSNDFTNPIVYLLTGADGSTASYTVTVTKAPYDANTIFTVAGNGLDYYTSSQEGILATQAVVWDPMGMALDSTGNIYIVGDQQIKKVDTNGIITTIAGNGFNNGFSGDGGPAILAELNNPSGVAADVSGNIYIVDAGNYRIRKVDTSGIITTIAGNGQQVYMADRVPATQSGMSPSGIAVDAAGNIYLADYGRVTRIDTNGIISTIAGYGQPTFSGDGGAATQAGLSPYSLAVDNAGTSILLI